MGKCHGSLSCGLHIVMCTSQGMPVVFFIYNEMGGKPNEIER